MTGTVGGSAQKSNLLCRSRHAGLSQREVAEHLGVALSAQVKLLNRAEVRDWLLARKLKRLESEIQDERGKIKSGGSKKNKTERLKFEF